MENTLDDGSKKRKIEIHPKKEGFVVTVDGFPHVVKGEMLPDGRIEFTINEQTFKAMVVRENDNYYVLIDGRSYKLRQVEDETITSIVEKNPFLKAHMPGRITKIFVKVGDIVKPKQQLLILEAMKMENVINAPYAGTVTTINAKVGDQVKEGQNLIKLDPLDKIE